ncbi:MAG: hypothetical protein FJX75_29670 [Armatimonadetes bacterium]|nr:hypothetical protein [Armatimonadota bacterium]
MEKTVLYFDDPGPNNTAPTLRASAQRAIDLGISQVVVATSTGKTALLAADAFPAGTKIVGVTLQHGLWKKYVGVDPELARQAQERGVVLLTCPHTLMGAVDSALRDQFGVLPPQQLIAHTYYTFSQGTKVAVECMMMAADAGLLDMGREVISIAGTDHGADTSLVLRPVYSHEFFSLKVHELIALPR